MWCERVRYYNDQKVCFWDINTDMRNRLVLVTLAMLISLKAYAFEDMRFFVPEFPPYTQIDSDGVPSGIGTEAVKQVLDSMGVGYTINVSSNHGRALQELRKQHSDGFFMASQNSERDVYAEFSEPLMINRWVWVVRQGSASNFNPYDATFKKQSTVASLLNTNTHHWLKSNDYLSVFAATSVNELQEKLDTGAVTAILIAELTFLDTVNDTRDYKIILEQEKEFGLYISKYFLSNNPGFMPKLNEAIRAYRNF